MYRDVIMYENCRGHLRRTLQLLLQSFRQFLIKVQVTSAKFSKIHRHTEDHFPPLVSAQLPAFHYMIPQKGNCLL